MVAVDGRSTSVNGLVPTLVVVGTAYHVPRHDTLDVLQDVAIVVDGDGVIAAIHPAESPMAASVIAKAARVERLPASSRLLPGMVDLHVHAPQWPQLGTGLDLPLERWLFEYTFPLEARYEDERFADAVWEHLVPTLLAHGTTTAVYFASVHEPATRLLAGHCMRRGQRAFVGRVAMDHPEGTPAWYRDSSAGDGVEASFRSIEAIRALSGGSTLVQPIITPRFVPACTDELLAGLGGLAGDTGVLVQTHCSESDWAHAYVFDRFGRSDATVLRDLGLLRERTVLAHGDHLGDDDFELIAAARAGIAHCPISNAYFANAVLPVRRAHAHGVSIGLGTDVAGGDRPGLLSNCAMAVAASRMLEDGVDKDRVPSERGVPGSRIDIVTAFHLATAGGADVLGLPVGRFAPGCRFDAFVVDLESSRSGLRRWEDIDSEARLFEKIVRLAGPADITTVWVDGRRVI
jgi:guanine deaminase